MTRLGRRMTSQWGSRTTVSSTTDRRQALAGADFVLTTIAVGGYTTWRQDQDIPARHGYHGHSVDTVGPGGLFRGLRLIPPLIDVCRDIESVCPSALLINYSNPMAGICRAVKKASKVRVVGLCTVGFLPAQVGRYLGIDPSRVGVISAGVNHWVWALKVMVDGQDFTEQFKAKMRERANDAWVRSSVELMEIFGAWPFPGANHVAEFFPYFYGPGDDDRSDERYRTRQGHDFNAEMAKSRKQRALLEAQAEGTEPLGHQPPEAAGEAVRILVSIWGDGRTVHYVNIPNGGLVDNLPPQAIVEIPALADASGVRGLKVGPLPDSVAGLMAARCAYYELLADAALQRSRRVALHCLMSDPLTASIPQAQACVEEMFAAQTEFLPGFA